MTSGASEVFRPFRAWLFSPSEPRASPWAIPCRPFGAENNHSFSLLRRPQRQLDREGRAFADHALDADAAVVLLDDLPAHAQAQARPAVAVLVRLLGRVERLEDQPQLLRRD